MCPQHLRESRRGFVSASTMSTAQFYELVAGGESLALAASDDGSGAAVLGSSGDVVVLTGDAFVAFDRAAARIALSTRDATLHVHRRSAGLENWTGLLSKQSAQWGFWSTRYFSIDVERRSVEWFKPLASDGEELGALDVKARARRSSDAVQGWFSGLVSPESPSAAARGASPAEGDEAPGAASPDVAAADESGRVRRGGLSLVDVERIEWKCDRGRGRSGHTDAGHVTITMKKQSAESGRVYVLWSHGASAAAEFAFTLECGRRGVKREWWSAPPPSFASSSRPSSSSSSSSSGYPTLPPSAATVRAERATSAARSRASTRLLPAAIAPPPLRYACFAINRGGGGGGGSGSGSGSGIDAPPRLLPPLADAATQAAQLTRVTAVTAAAEQRAARLQREAAATAARDAELAALAAELAAL